MTEYTLYATGSAQPITGATISFYVTTDPSPLLYYFGWGVICGCLLTLVIILLNNLIWTFYDRLLERNTVKKVSWPEGTAFKEGPPTLHTSNKETFRIKIEPDQEG